MYDSISPLEHFPSAGQKENTRHGESFFPLQRYLSDLNASHSLVTAHWHEEAELTQILTGECRYQIDLQKYRLHAGDFVLIAPAQLHSITLTCDFDDKEYSEAGMTAVTGLSSKTDMTSSAELPSKIGMTSETYVFHLNFLGADSADLCASQYLAPLSAGTLRFPCVIPAGHPAYETVSLYFSQIHTLYEEKPEGYELQLRAYFLLILCALLPYTSRRSENETSPDSIQMEKMKTVLKYIDSHLAEPLTVSELAQLCNYSDYHFMRFFRKHAGMTCIEYIQAMRAKKASRLLKEGKLSVLDAALSSGFNNLSYFYKVFKNHYGMTPKEFQRKFC